MTDLIRAARRAAASVLFVLLAVPAFAQSQATTGEVKGRIVDAQGAVLPGVSHHRPQRCQRLRPDRRHRRSGAVHDAAAAARQLRGVDGAGRLRHGAAPGASSPSARRSPSTRRCSSPASPKRSPSPPPRRWSRRRRRSGRNRGQRGDRQPADQRAPLPGLRHPDPDRPDRHLARPAVVRRPARHQLERQHRRRRLQPAVLRRPARRRTEQQRLHGAPGRGAGVPGDRRRLLGRVRPIDRRAGQRGDQVGRQPGGRVGVLRQPPPRAGRQERLRSDTRRRPSSSSERRSAARSSATGCSSSAPTSSRSSATSGPSPST